MATDSRTTQKHRGGRRKGTTVTREAILHAAVEAFAERGYEGATLRSITAKAGVDVSLVGHFFGGKQGLFEEAVLSRGDENLRTLVIADPAASPAARILDAYFSIWENPKTSLTARALFRAALESEENRHRLEELISDRLTETVQRLAAQRNDEQSSESIRLQTQLIASHLLGIGISRYIMHIAPLADTPREELITRLEPILNAYFAPSIPSR